jgi:hypothetical protein
MKKLTLNLTDAVANQFKSLPPEQRSRIEKLLSRVLEEIFKKKANDALFALFDKASEQAEKNGLTVNELAELMEWDEQTVKNLFGEQAVGNEQ